jgi:FkbM family methyltransferase
MLRTVSKSETLHKIAKLRWLPIRHWFDLRQAMRLKVSVRDPEDGYRYQFRADSLHSYQRARAHLSKEPLTIGWLRENLRPTDVLLDIGANIGTFSIFAARHISDEGHVYACEPHLPTAVQLLQNVVANRLESRISAISIAASDADGFFPFHYKRWREGASGSQLAVDSGVAMARRVGTELKFALRVDSMIAQGLRRPNLVKIDTDGLEPQILRGMTNLLRSEERPRSILVEVQRGKLQEQVNFMESCGYSLLGHHLLGKGRRAMERGEERDLSEVAFNAVFQPKGESNI